MTGLDALKKAETDFGLLLKKSQREQRDAQVRSEVYIEALATIQTLIETVEVSSRSIAP
jgi:hypothetical protein